MMSNITRPNFFPGQLIDYKDFNKLSEQSDKMMSLLCRTLYKRGGVIVDTLNEFSVNPLKGLSVLVNPGMALLPSGQPLILSEELVVDLSPYATTKKGKLVIVSLVNQIKGEDKFKDRVDDSISGYLTEAFHPEVVITSKVAAENGIELFRIFLNEGMESLRLSRASDEWHGADIVDSDEKDVAVVDTRYRHRIVPQTYMPIDTNEMIHLRTALYSIETSHRKMTKIYLVEDKFSTLQYLAQLHAELLCRPFQPLKVAFLASEFAEKASCYLGALNVHLGQRRTNFDKDKLLNVIEKLEPLKTRQVLPDVINLKTIPQIATLLEEIVKYAEERFSLLDTVEESLVDIEHRLLSNEPRIVLAGHVFDRIDLVTVDDTSKWVMQSNTVHSRNLTTNYKNGDRLSLKGQYVKEGMISVKVNVPEPDRPVVLLAHQHIRRGGSKVHFEINGKHLHTDDAEFTEMNNVWRNKGLVIPKEHLVANENLIKIRIEKSDLDFGFFDIAVYQPSVEKGAN